MSVCVNSLCKKYGDVVAVSDLSLQVKSGSLFAFLGANGAGKTTTIGCITTTLAPTSGTIEVDGHDAVADPQSVRLAIGAVFQSSLLDPLLTVRENLEVRAGCYGIARRQAAARIDELVELVGAAALADRRYGLLSGG